MRDRGNEKEAGAGKYMQIREMNMPDGLIRQKGTESSVSHGAYISTRARSPSSYEYHSNAFCDYFLLELSSFRKTEAYEGVQDLMQS